MNQKEQTKSASCLTQLLIFVASTGLSTFVFIPPAIMCGYLYVAAYVFPVAVQQGILPKELTYNQAVLMSFFVYATVSLVMVVNKFFMQFGDKTD